MNNRNGNINKGTPRDLESSWVLPPVYRDNFSNVIVGGSCDGDRADTPPTQEVVVLQASPPDLEKITKQKPGFTDGNKVLDMLPSESYRWTAINSVTGKTLNAQKILVDLVNRFWFRVPVGMSDGEAVKFLVSNYSKHKED